MRNLAFKCFFLCLFLGQVAYASHGGGPSVQDDLGGDEVVISLKEYTQRMGLLKHRFDREDRLNPMPFIVPEKKESVKEIHEYLKEKYSALWPNLEREGWWQWLVDSDRTAAEEALGPNLFEENERHYIRGMAQGFAFMLAHLKKPLSVNMIIAFHDLAVGGVERTQVEPAKGTQKEFERGLVKAEGRRWGYHLDPELCPKKISLEFEADGLRDFVSIGDDLFLSLKREDEAVYKRPEWLMRYFLEKYQDELLETESDPDLIKLAISRLMRRLVSAHFFPDGNGRTFVFILLNRLLLENGLGPAVMAHSRVFNVDSFSLKGFSLREKSLDWQLEIMAHRIGMGQRAYKKRILGIED